MLSCRHPLVRVNTRMRSGALPGAICGAGGGRDPRAHPAGTMATAKMAKVARKTDLMMRERRLFMCPDCHTPGEGEPV
ncbi:hypothetical protein GCM10027359_11310 [Marilutibacter aestuarii]